MPHKSRIKEVINQKETEKAREWGGRIRSIERLPLTESIILEQKWILPDFRRIKILPALIQYQHFIVFTRTL